MAGAGFTQMPFTFIFNGGFFDLEHLFRQITGFTVHTSDGGLEANGRLLTIQSVKLAPESTTLGKTPKLIGTITATAYVLPASQGLTNGATAAAPAGASTPASTTASGLRSARRRREGDPVNELFSSIKADLTDRRLLPMVALVGVCLLAALAYALLGGSSASAPSGPAVAPPAPVSGIAVSTATIDKAVAETPDGVSGQRGGTARNPFAPLPGSSVPVSGSSSAGSSGSSSSGGGSSSSSAVAASSETSSSSSGSSETSGGGSSSGGSSPASGQKKPKQQQAYRVTVELGKVPAGAIPEATALTAFKNLKLQAPLPSSSQTLVVFRGVTAKGKSATFTLVGEPPILTGVGACLPSAAQCQALDLKPGEYEQLSYLQPNGETTTWN